MLNEAGAKTTQEDIHLEMFSADGVSLTDVQELNQLLLSAFFHDSSKKKEVQGK